MMICPRCEEGLIIPVRLKINHDKAFVCNFCEALWLEGEDIHFNTGHTFDSYSSSDEYEYTVEMDENEEYSPVHYVKYK